jgi:hypothetical protein
VAATGFLTDTTPPCNPPLRLSGVEQGAWLAEAGLASVGPLQPLVALTTA